MKAGQSYSTHSTENNKLTPDNIRHETSPLYAREPKQPKEDKRKIVECLVEKIVIGDGEIDITPYHRPPSEEV